jgi:hypothetical protein
LARLDGKQAWTFKLFTAVYGLFGFADGRVIGMNHQALDVRDIGRARLGS